LSLATPTGKNDTVAVWRMNSVTFEVKMEVEEAEAERELSKEDLGEDAANVSAPHVELIL
jgi:hypothetical protein